MTEDIDTSDDEEVHLEVIAEEDQQSSPTSSWSKGDSPVAQREGCERTTSNVAQDVLTRKGQYGRFAERWFSRKGWSTEKRRAQGSKARFFMLLSHSATLLERATFSFIPISSCVTVFQGVLFRLLFDDRLFLLGPPIFIAAMQPLSAAPLHCLILLDVLMY